MQMKPLVVKDEICQNLLLPRLALIGDSSCSSRLKNLAHASLCYTSASHFRWTLSQNVSCYQRHITRWILGSLFDVGWEGIQAKASAERVKNVISVQRTGNMMGIQWFICVHCSLCLPSHTHTQTHLFLLTKQPTHAHDSCKLTSSSQFSP